MAMGLAISKTRMLFILENENNDIMEGIDKLERDNDMDRYRIYHYLNNENHPSRFPY